MSHVILISLNLDKPVRVYVANYTQNLDTSEYDHLTEWFTDDTNQPVADWSEEWTTNHYDQHWTDELGGGGSSSFYDIGLYSINPYDYTNFWTEQMSWPGTNWENAYELGGTGIYSGNDCGTTPTNVPVNIGSPFFYPPYGSYIFYPENCNESDPNGPVSSYGWEGGYSGYEEYYKYDVTQTYVRHAQTTLKLHTGGRAVPGQKSLI